MENETDLLETQLFGIGNALVCLSRDMEQDNRKKETELEVRTERCLTWRML